MSKKNHDQKKPRFDMYPLFSQWDLWLVVAFIFALLAYVIYRMSAPITA